MLRRRSTNSPASEKVRWLFVFDFSTVLFILSSSKALAVSQAEMGNKLVNVASTEAHPPVANALRKLGRTWHSISDLDQAASISECVIIGDTLGYQGMNARSAKETLAQRTSVLEEYQAAVKSSISKRRYIERLKASSNINSSKVDEALEDLEEVYDVVCLVYASLILLSFIGRQVRENLGATRRWHLA